LALRSLRPACGLLWRLCLVWAWRCPVGFGVRVLAFRCWRAEKKRAGYRSTMRGFRAELERPSGLVRRWGFEGVGGGAHYLPGCRSMASHHRDLRAHPPTDLAALTYRARAQWERF
jgi:hypothetical protein